MRGLLTKYAVAWPSVSAIARCRFMGAPAASGSSVLFLACIFRIELFVL